MSNTKDMVSSPSRMSVLKQTFSVCSKDFFATRLRKPGNVSFFMLVLLPWLIFCSYVCFIKTPEYESNARFLLGASASNVTGNTGQLGAMFQRGKHAIVGTESAFVNLLEKYVYSQAMLSILKDTVDIQSYYQSVTIDYLSRLKKSPNQNELLSYYLKKVRVLPDPTTGELMLSVRAFSPDKAQEILSVIEENLVLYVKKIRRESLAEQSHTAKVHLEQARNKIIQEDLELTDLLKKSKINASSKTAELHTKRLELSFAKTEYEAAQQAYVLWHVATRHPMPVTTSPASLSDYAVSPQLPKDVVSVLLILTIMYCLGFMIFMVIREHVD
jgi:capsule polysaccharide export protein KpsE/RkpR